VDRRLELAKLSQFLVESVEQARASDVPFYHLEFERVFPDDIYAAMLREMPVGNDYRALPGQNNVNLQADGSSTRVKLDLFPEYVRKLPPAKRDIWDLVGRALCSKDVKAAFMRRLAPALEQRFGARHQRVRMFPIPILTRDIPNYRIDPHTDTRWKGITVQFYLPPDDSTKHIGTIFHECLSREEKIFKRVKQMPFSPNSGYAFAVGKDTWHSADPVGPEVETRDSILHTYFVDDGPLQFWRNRGKRIGNFLGDEARRLLRR
jgi:hypothetical protein